MADTPSAAEMRAIFGKDAFKLVTRSRTAMPRPTKVYKCLAYESTQFSFADFGSKA